MNMKETHSVMRVMKAGFPVYYKKCTPEEVKESTILMASMFEEDNAEDVLYAVRAFIASDTAGFPPKIGQTKPS